MVVCPLHPCKCGKCGKTNLKCGWRAKAARFIADNKLQHADGSLTYIQAIESAGLQAPTSARERNLLNILARLPMAQPLQETLMVSDITQAADRQSIKYDGTMPTMTTHTKMWVVRAGRPLLVSEMAKLMGLDLNELIIDSTSAGSMRKMLGMGMHVGTAGFAICGLLGAVGN